MTFRHLHGVEAEIVLERDIQHVQMNLGTLMSREADVAYLPCRARFDHGLKSATGPEDLLGVVHSSYIVELDQIDVVHL
jgi:hypothetical protein